MDGPSLAILNSVSTFSVLRIFVKDVYQIELTHISGCLRCIHGKSCPDVFSGFLKLSFFGMSDRLPDVNIVLSGRLTLLYVVQKQLFLLIVKH